MNLCAQSDSTFVDFSAYVRLDSIMITATREGFSVEEFIKIIQNDNTLETSFNNLRLLSYAYSNDIKFYKNNGQIKASYKSLNKQYYNGDCQWMVVRQESVSGNYFNRKNENKYYTSDLYDRVFYQSIQPCAERSAGKNISRSKKILEKRIDELKNLIYTPGIEANIPLIGRKTAIFSEEMIHHYDFSLKLVEVIPGIQGYLFTAAIKPLFNDHHPNGSVVKYLEVLMSKDNFQVLSRRYKLKYSAGIYKFDINISVVLEKYKEYYIPSEIIYEGYWKIVGKKKEICTFQFNILDFME